MTGTPRIVFEMKAMPRRQYSINGIVRNLLIRIVWVVAPLELKILFVGDFQNVPQDAKFCVCDCKCNIHASALRDALTHFASAACIFSHCFFSMATRAA